jgi:hypothetical protein
MDEIRNIREIFYRSLFGLLTGCGIMFIGQPVKEVVLFGIPARG